MSKNKDAALYESYQPTKIEFIKLSEDAKIPTLNNPCDAGVDFYSTLELTAMPNSSITVSTGIAWQPPIPLLGYKWVMIIQSRSGLAFKKCVEASNAGVIDQSYRGEIKVKIYNNSNEVFKVNKGDKIAQGIIKFIPDIEVVEGFEIKETSRGANGFGSSGN